MTPSRMRTSKLLAAANRSDQARGRSSQHELSYSKLSELPSETTQELLLPRERLAIHFTIATDDSRSAFSSGGCLFLMDSDRHVNPLHNSNGAPFAFLPTPNNNLAASSAFQDRQSAQIRLLKASSPTSCCYPATPPSPVSANA